jgi:ribose transport system ATP-binding protein
MGEVILKLEGITKTFPGVLALDQCQFDLRSGEVHALVGENGAGKSTLMKVLAGSIRKTPGTLSIKDRVDIPTLRGSSWASA